MIRLSNVLKRNYWPISCYTKEEIPSFLLSLKVNNNKNIKLKVNLFEHRVPESTENLKKVLKNKTLNIKDLYDVKVLAPTMIVFNNKNKTNDSYLRHEHYDKFNKKGLIGLVNEGKDTVSTSFFITLSELPNLNHNNVVLGEVTQGLDELFMLNPTDKVSLALCEEDKPTRIYLDPK